jgi:hypothetical protein
MANGTGDTPAYQTERAHRDLDASIEAGRAACQAAILINGGAATALLAYLAGKAGQPGAPGALVRAACIAFGCYAIGVFQGALSTRNLTGGEAFSPREFPQTRDD